MSFVPKTLKGYDVWLASKECNGCGAGWNTKLVPDTIYGMGITDCCCPHDYAYEIGLTQAEKVIADCDLLDNINNKIDSDTKWWRNNRFIKNRMKLRALVYYHAVDSMGDSAYWEGKKHEKDIICDTCNDKF